VAAAWPLFEGERITLLEMVELDGEVERMKKDDVGPGAANAASGGDSQNRREFFNGLGKWSAIVVAAVSFLGAAREALAKKPKPHYKHENSVAWVNQPHTQYPKYAKDPGGGKVME
jgi:hypothetical protein